MQAAIPWLVGLEGQRRQRFPSEPDPRWWRRNLGYLLAVGGPLLLGIGLSIEPAIRVAGRVDDGDRGERWIVGNGVALSWAPAGPGWPNPPGSLTWNEIALYGLPPVGFEGKERGRDGLCSVANTASCATADDMRRYGVCRYLNEDGTRLMAEPQGYWRMPTVDELVRSLGRHGQNAGCTWTGHVGPQPCIVRPDKETPLWNPTAMTIYYWSADERDAGSAFQVVYNGRVESVHKFSGLGSLGYRCVRDG